MLPKDAKGMTHNVNPDQTAHSGAVPIADTDIYKCSFFPQTIRDWNALPDSRLISSAGAEDSEVHFTGES